MIKKISQKLKNILSKNLSVNKNNYFEKLREDYNNQFYVIESKQNPYNQAKKILHEKLTKNEKKQIKDIEEQIIQTENHTLKLDFYLEEQGQKFAIEYNGIQHYEPVEFFGGESEFVKQQERDSEKKKYCQENNITLICIPYNNEYLIESEALAQRLRGQVTE